MKKDEINGEDKPKFTTLEVSGTKYTTLLTVKYQNQKPYVKPDLKKVLSLLPGTIIKVSIKKGDKVKSGQNLLVFEAMKMLNTVKAKQAAVIKDIYVKPGDKISKNFLMFEYE